MKIPTCQGFCAGPPDPKRTERFDRVIAYIRGPWWSSEDQEQADAAIAVLEAAGNFTADDIERISNTLDDFIEYAPIADYKCPGRVLKDKFITFLKAIPALPDEVAK